MALTIEWNLFKEGLTEHVKEGINILNEQFNTVNNQSELESVKDKIKEWSSSCYNYLNEAFGEINNDFSEAFRTANTGGFRIPSRNGFNQISLIESIQQEKNELKEKINTLKYFLKILPIYDAIIKPNQIDLISRESYTTEEILELVLDKLFEVYDDSYYPLAGILEGNGIKLKRHGEEHQLAKILENQGLVDVFATRNVSIRLSTEGKMYIENKRKIYSVNYDTINGSSDELNKKIDFIIEELNKNNLGHEILFDELQELKDLYGKLNKKNWGELLKGKLIDLGLSQVINIDVAKFIFNEITSNVLRLP